MRVFLSWSGKVSHEVALTLRDWLPLVIQTVDTYVSSEDIDKGTRWSMDIAQELEKCSYGVICVTKQNLFAPWVNFEAGALSKFVSESFVSPFLFDIKKSEVTGPLLQFQATSYEKDDVKKLLKGINKACGEQQLEESRLENVFEAMWPMLKKRLDDVLENNNQESEDSETSVTEKKESQNERVLEEILELARSQQKILKTPKELFPQDYFKDQITDLFHEVAMLSRSSKEAELFKVLTEQLRECLITLELTYKTFPTEQLLENNPMLKDCDTLTELLELVKENQITISRKIEKLSDELYYVANKMADSIEHRVLIPEGMKMSELRTIVNNGLRDKRTAGGIRRVPLKTIKE